MKKTRTLTGMWETAREVEKEDYSRHKRKII